MPLEESDYYKDRRRHVVDVGGLMGLLVGVAASISYAGRVMRGRIDGGAVDGGVAAFGAVALASGLVGALIGLFGGLLVGGVWRTWHRRRREKTRRTD